MTRNVIRGALSCLVEMKALRGGRDSPAVRDFQLRGTGDVCARCGKLNRDRALGAGREQLHARHEPKRDRRNHIQSAVRGRISSIRRLHRLARNHQGLTANFEDVLDRECGRVLRTPDERRIVDAKHAHRTWLAQPIRLAWRRVGGQRLGIVTDERLVGAQVEDRAELALDAGVTHRGPANREA